MTIFSTQEFIDLIDISEQDNDQGFGHYPMQIAFVKKDDNIELNAMAVNEIRIIYERIRQHRGQAKEIFVSIDFGAIGDMTTDFVFVAHEQVEKEEIAACLLPYDPKTGQKFAIIYKSKVLEHLKRNYIENSL